MTALVHLPLGLPTLSPAKKAELTLLKNIGVRTSPSQLAIRAQFEASVKAGHLEAADKFFSANKFISGAEPGEQDDSAYASLLPYLSLVIAGDSVSGCV